MLHGQRILPKYDDPSPTGDELTKNGNRADGARASSNLRPKAPANKSDPSSMKMKSHGLLPAFASKADFWFGPPTLVESKSTGIVYRCEFRERGSQRGIQKELRRCQMEPRRWRALAFHVGRRNQEAPSIRLHEIVRKVAVAVATATAAQQGVEKRGSRFNDRRCINPSHRFIGQTVSVAFAAVMPWPFARALRFPQSLFSKPRRCRAIAANVCWRVCR